MNVSNISRAIIDKVDTINRIRQDNSKNVGNGRHNGDVSNKAFAREDIYEAVDKLNDTMGLINERVSFSYHEKTNRIIVKVIDSQTNEVVREIPPRDIIKLQEHIQEYLGMLVDESR